MNRGLTLVELSIGIAVGMILLGVLVLFMTRGVNLSREQTEQKRITEDARVQMERMSDAIRDARSIDVTNDGAATLPSENWRQGGSDYDIQFYSNIDEDPEIERVHYFLDGVELKRGLRDPYSSVEETVVVVARSIRNRERQRPLFTFTSGEGQTQVGIVLLVDVNPRQAPGVAEVATIVVPRASEVVLSP